MGSNNNFKESSLRKDYKKSYSPIPTSPPRNKAYLFNWNTDIRGDRKTGLVQISKFSSGDTSAKTIITNLFLSFSLIVVSSAYYLAVVVSFPCWKRHVNFIKACLAALTYLLMEPWSINICLLHDINIFNCPKQHVIVTAQNLLFLLYVTIFLWSLDCI